MLNTPQKPGFSVGSTHIREVIRRCLVLGEWD